MIANFDTLTSDEERSAWAESDAPVVALSANRVPEHSDEADSALEVFRRAARLTENRLIHLNKLSGCLMVSIH